jgi:hypothetical protein
MENERLLSNGEIAITIDRMDGFGEADFWFALCKYQDAKSIAALIAWAESNCDDIGHHCGMVKRQCYDCWQELKESVK